MFPYFTEGLQINIGYPALTQFRRTGTQMEPRAICAGRHGG